MQKILVLCDDLWHPAEVIEKGFEELKDSGFKFEFVKDAKDILTPEMISEYPLIINCKSYHLTHGNSADWFEPGVTEVGPKEFEEYIRNGGSLLSIHAGNSFTEDHSPEFAALIGNIFVKHPPRCEVELRSIAKHPVTEGVEPFTIRDEHYEIRVTADDATLFLESESETGGIQTAGYVRNLGEGKICVLTPGHILSVWKHPMFKKLVMNAINWCIG